MTDIRFGGNRIRLILSRYKFLLFFTKTSSFFNDLFLQNDNVIKQGLLINHFSGNKLILLFKVISFCTKNCYIMFKKMKNISLSLIILLLSIEAFSQKTYFYFEPENSYRDGIELMQKEKYVAAQKKFSAVFATKIDHRNPIYVQSKFYYAVCAYNLTHKNTESLFLEFIDEYHQESLSNLAHFYLARWYFNKKNYIKCLKELEKVDTYELTSSDQIEYKYRKAYCHFSNNELNEAKKLFFEVKKLESKFKSQATYYYAHIAYTEGLLETALIDFMLLKNDEYYSSIVPYYIIQIYYLQQNFEQIFALAPELFEKSSEKRKPEIKRILGEAYYNENKFKEAIPHLNYYLEAKETKPTRSDNYIMGFCQYQTGSYTKALEYLKNVIEQPDSLSQNSYFIIGDCYIKTNQKQYASNAFYEAYKINIDQEITEEALFNYAKLQYEFSSNPFQSAISSFEEYVNTFPNSQRIDEVNEYLLTIYQTTKNYKEAINSLEKIKNKNHKLLKAYQQIAHFRGIELFNNSDFANAIIYFDKSLKNDFDSKINAFNHYWKGEAYYQMSKYNEAIESYNKFLLAKGAFDTPEYAKSYYSIGYCWFKQKSFANALTAFRKFLNDTKNVQSKEIISDAYNRAGDCYFITKEFNQSIQMYDKAIELNTLDVDYALYQKSIALGANGKMQEKKEVILQLLNNYPKSNWVDESQYELGNTYVALNELDKAVAEYSKMIEKFPNSKNIRSAKLKQGLAYYNMSEDEKALSILKKVVEDYPGTQESKDALKNIRNIYVDNNNVDEFFNYVKQIPTATVSSSEQDSLTFKVVENRFLDNDCEKAKKGAIDYIEKFPQGYFILKAHYYKAECEYKSGNLVAALESYETLLQKFPKSNYEERALLLSADILYQQKNYVKAAEYYSRLQPIASNQTILTGALTGKMRSYFIIQNYSEAITAAQELLKRDKLSESIIEECRLTIVRSAMQTQQYNVAKAESQLLLKSKNEASAEAYYVISEIEFKQGNFDTSEKRIFDLLSSGSPYEYWLAKSYILLGDIYVEKGNLFQAKHTYKSIMDNYEGEDLKKIATDKFQYVITLENDQKNKNQSEFDHKEE